MKSSASFFVQKRAGEQGKTADYYDGIYGAGTVQKSNCFRPEAFGGRDFGCLGYMQDASPFFVQSSLRPHTTGTEFSVEGKHTLPKVEIAYFYADADPGILDYLAERSEGLVIAGAGAGLMSIPWRERLAAIAARIPVVRTTRTGNGIVTREHTDDSLGTIPGGLLTPVRARILLSLALCVTKDRNRLEQIIRNY